MKTSAVYFKTTQLHIFSNNFHKPISVKQIDLSGNFTYRSLVCQHTFRNVNYVIIFMLILKKTEPMNRSVRLYYRGEHLLTGFP